MKSEHAEYPTSERRVASSSSSSMVAVAPWSRPSAHAASAPFLGAALGLGLPLDFALALLTSSQKTRKGKTGVHRDPAIVVCDCYCNFQKCWGKINFLSDLIFSDHFRESSVFPALLSCRLSWSCVLICSFWVESAASINQSTNQSV